MLVTGGDMFTGTQESAELFDPLGEEEEKDGGGNGSTSTASSSGAGAGGSSSSGMRPSQEFGGCGCGVRGAPQISELWLGLGLLLWARRRPRSFSGVAAPRAVAILNHRWRCHSRIWSPRSLG